MISPRDGLGGWFEGVEQCGDGSRSRTSTSSLRSWAPKRAAQLPEVMEVDHVARFQTSTGLVGYGLHEHGFRGPFAKYGIHDAYGGAT